MKHNDMQNPALHREILSEMITDITAESRIDDDRLEAVASGKAEFTADEMRLMLRCAATQDRYAVLKEKIRARVMRHWRKKRLQTPVLTTLAAADDSVKPFHQVCGDYTVDLHPMDPQGRRWRMTVTFSQALLAATQGGIRVIENAKAPSVFVAGVPDSKGRLIAFFDADDKAQKRIRDNGLMIEPM